MSTPHGYSLFVPDAIRTAVDLPVVGVGRFTTPDQVRAALADGVCDLVGAVRAHIADPGFAGKVLDGRGDEIRPCIGCNQDCIGRVGLGRPIGCARRRLRPLPDRRRRLRGGELARQSRARSRGVGADRGGRRAHSAGGHSHRHRTAAHSRRHSTGRRPAAPRSGSPGPDPGQPATRIESSSFQWCPQPSRNGLSDEETSEILKSPPHRTRPAPGARAGRISISEPRRRSQR